MVYMENVRKACENAGEYSAGRAKSRGHKKKKETAV